MPISLLEIYHTISISEIIVAIMPTSAWPTQRRRNIIEFGIIEIMAFRGDL